VGEHQQRLNRKEASALLATLGYPIAPRTLGNLAGKGKGPPYVRFGHRIVSYERDALVAWARRQMVVVRGDDG
jgi:hypothetical protein